jgi:hypothetical protein
MEEYFQYFNQQVIESAEYFENWFYLGKEISETKNQSKSETVYSKLIDALKENHQRRIGENYQYAHNCIGCNLEEGARNILLFFNYNKETLSTRYFLTMYTLVFYLQAERLAVIYKELGYIRKENGEFDWLEFPNLHRIYRWANFFKHPKSYMLLHHPDFFIEGDSYIPNFMVNQIIDDEFVLKYYNGKKNNVELRGKLANQESVKVIFPNLLEFTKNACCEFENIIRVITNENSHLQTLSNFTSSKI